MHMHTNPTHRKVFIDVDNMPDADSLPPGPAADRRSTADSNLPMPLAPIKTSWLNSPEAKKDGKNVTWAEPAPTDRQVPLKALAKLGVVPKCA